MTPHSIGERCLGGTLSERQFNGGRPVRESRTPVNTGNQPCRDEGETEAGNPQPLPYPLKTFYDFYSKPKLYASSATVKLNRYRKTNLIPIEGLAAIVPLQALRNEPSIA